MEFFRQEYCNGLSFPPSGDLRAPTPPPRDPIQVFCVSFTSRQILSLLSHQGSPVRVFIHLNINIRNVVGYLHSQPTFLLTLLPLSTFSSYLLLYLPTTKICFISFENECVSFFSHPQEHSCCAQKS